MGKKKKAIRRRKPKSERPAPEVETTEEEATATSSEDTETSSHEAEAEAEAEPEDDDELEREPETEDDDEPPSSGSKPPAASPPPRKGAAWATPVVKFERGWSWLETRLLFIVLLTLVFALTLWVSLNGLASPLETDNSSGTVFRALLGGGVAGMLVRITTRRRLPERARNGLTAIAMLIGVVAAPYWRESGVEYFGNILNWLQEGSVLTLFGGLRGVATRLTILLALIGASLAAGSGKHINIDVVLRLIKPAFRLPVYVVGTLATAAVCFGASWGFFDYISIEGFGANLDAPRAEKVETVKHSLKEQAFIWRKQVALDLKAAPDVLGGMKWDDESRMNGRQWNEFVYRGGYANYFDEEEMKLVVAPDFALEESRVPFVVMPGHSTRGLLIHAMNLMWCIGLIFIGIRVLMRSFLVVTGHSTVEPDPDEFEHVDPEVKASESGPKTVTKLYKEPSESESEGESEGESESESEGESEGESESEDESEDESETDDEADDAEKKGGR